MTTLLVLLLLFAALAVAAVRWGADTRDGRDWQPLEDPANPAGQPPAGPAGRLAAARRAVGDAWADQVELQERMALLNRPWEETYLHWAGTGEHRQLHGSVPPPRPDRRYSVTRSGWCPASGQPAGRGTIGA